MRANEKDTERLDPRKQNKSWLRVESLQVGGRDENMVVKSEKKSSKSYMDKMMSSIIYDAMQQALTCAETLYLA